MSSKSLSITDPRAYALHILNLAKLLLLLLLSQLLQIAVVTTIVTFATTICCATKSLLQSDIPGAVELTTQLLRTINILWLPLCRINKLW